MGAQRRRVLWRYALGEVVYVRGMHGPYTVVEHEYVAVWKPPSEHVTYKLRDTEGATFRIIEAHIHSAPAQRDQQ